MYYRKQVENLKYTKMFKWIIIGVGFFIISIIIPNFTFAAPRLSDKNKLHPMNKKLIQTGQMTVTKYFMNIPRITAAQASALYKANRAVFVLNSYQDKDLIVGGHWSKKVHNKVDYNQLVNKGQILVFY